jgi:hypothetical protein
MNVAEGLTCSFRQQAVAIDQDKGEFTLLGNVRKTVTVTPDLNRAFTRAANEMQVSTNAVIT